MSKYFRIIGNYSDKLSDYRKSTLPKYKCECGKSGYVIDLKNKKKYGPANTWADTGFCECGNIPEFDLDDKFTYSWYKRNSGK